MLNNHKLFTRFLSALMVFVLSGLLLAGCKDQLLNKKPRGKLTQASFFENKDQAIQATNATYQQMRDFNVHSFPWLGLTDIASDDASKGSTPADASFLSEVDNFTLDASNGALMGPWQAYYQGIYRANIAIQKIPDIDMDTQLRDRLVGENIFLRAYYYFFLVRAFGGVPLVTKPLKPDEFNQSRASVEEVYAQIENDLKDAMAVLPLKSVYNASDMGRATKGAAQGLLAKVYLFEKKYQDAQQMAENVINSNEYSLLPDYGKIFTPEGENSSGSIFEIQAVAVETGQGGTPYSVVQGVRGTPNLGWGFNNPTRDLLQAYEDGDPRMEPTVLFVNEELPDGTDAVRDNPNMNDERYNQKPFIPLDNPGGNFNGGSNIRRLRYADIILIAAEAAYQNGDADKARQYVNMVRQRARDGQEATIGLQVEPVAGFVADTLGDASLSGQPFIRYITSGSPADNASLQQFDWELQNNGSALVINNIDIIQSVNGNSVSSVDDFKSQMKSMQSGSNVSLQVQRITETYDAGSGTINRSSQTVLATATTEQLLPDITSSGQDLLDAIWHERRVELAMEQQRFFDLQREGRAGEVLRAQGKQYNDDVNNVYPIPQQELDIDPNLNQNPGY